MTPTPEHREEQRRSFAYGNTAFENARITREMVDQQAKSWPTKMPSEPRETRHSRALIAHAFARAQAEGFTRAIIETHVQNTRAHALLERMGFERTASHAQDRIKWERAL